MKRRVVVFSLPDEEYIRLTAYAQAKGFGTTKPLSVLAHYALYQYEKRNKLTTDEHLAAGSSTAKEDA